MALPPLLAALGQLDAAGEPHAWARSEADCPESGKQLGNFRRGPDMPSLVELLREVDEQERSGGTRSIVLDHLAQPTYKPLAGGDGFLRQYGLQGGALPYTPEVSGPFLASAVPYLSRIVAFAGAGGGGSINVAGPTATGSNGTVLLRSSQPVSAPESLATTSLFSFATIDSSAANFSTVEAEPALQPSPQAATSLSGDANGDGVVNLADYTLWRDNLGTSSSTADYDGSGSVDTHDYTTWKQSFESASTPVTPSDVTEPVRGDANGDGAVNLADYTVWRDQLGSPGPAGDLDGSGLVDEGDYGVWREGVETNSTAQAPAEVDAPFRPNLQGMGFYGRPPAGTTPASSVHKFIVDRGEVSIINIDNSATEASVAIAGRVRRDDATFTPTSHIGLYLEVFGDGRLLNRDPGAFQVPATVGDSIEFDTTFDVSAGRTTVTYKVGRGFDEDAEPQDPPPADVFATDSLTGALFSGTVEVNRIPEGVRDFSTVRGNSNPYMPIQPYESRAGELLSNDLDNDRLLAAGRRVDEQLRVTRVNGVQASVGQTVPLKTGSEATVRVDSDGTFVFSPNGQFDALDDGAKEMVFFDYSISDGIAEVENILVTVTIEGINDPPRLASPTVFKRVRAGEATVLNPNEQYTDPEMDQISTIEIVSQPSSGEVEVFADAGDNLPRIRYIDAGTTSGSDTVSFQYRVRDSQGNLSEDVATVVMAPVDKPIVTEVEDDVTPRVDVITLSGGFTNDTLPVIRGTAEPSSEVVVSFTTPSGPIVVSGIVTDRLGEWEVELATALGEGQHVVTVTAKTISGAEIIESTSEPFAFTIDVTNPVASFEQVLPPLSTSAVDSLAIYFSDPDEDPIQGFERSDLRLTRDGSSQDLLQGSAASVVATTTPSSEWVLQDIGNLTSQTGVYQLTLVGGGAAIVDRAGNPLVGTTTMTFAVDVDPPTLSNVDLVSGPFADSELPGFVVPSTGGVVTLTLDVRDLAPALPAAGVIVEAFDENNQRLPGQPSDGVAASLSGTTTITFDVGTNEGAQAVILRATDRAGNVTTVPITITVLGEAQAGLNSPGTPVYSTLYKLNEALDKKGLPVFEADEEFFPWQMAFDNRTQTIYFTMDQTNDFAIFDPATGYVKVLDLAVIDELAGIMSKDENGNLTETFRDPHGATFDFNSHNTPRAWFVHRAAAERLGDVSGARPARLSYLDVVSNELVIYDFTDSGTAANLSSEMLNAASVFHAVFVDSTGDLWAVSLASNSILQFDFDNGSSLDSRTAQFRVHEIPEGFGTGAQPSGNMDGDFEPHALEVIVDEQTGEQYVWFIAEGGSGRVGLLRPGSSTADGVDHWHTWDIDEARGARGSFVKIDDNETPGIPQDDKVIATFPVSRSAGQTATRGLVYELSPMLENKGEGGPLEASVRTWDFPAITGFGDSAAATNQPFMDREGVVYVIDRLGSVVRFHPDDMPAAESTVTSIYVQSGSPVNPVVVNPTQISGSYASPDGTAINLSEIKKASAAAIREGWIPEEHITTKDAYAMDRETSTDFDQYELKGPDVNPGASGAGLGAFRAALNATNTLYGSLARNGMLSTTVFAETARRQMVAVPSPTKGDLALRGRMAFQVLSDGSIILTGRPDGSILDEQIRLTKLLVDSNKETLGNLKVSGDLTAFVEPLREVNEVYVGGELHLYGKNEAGKIVHFMYTGDWSFGTKFSDPGDWQVSVSDALSNPSEVLSGDPRVAPDGNGVYITTSEGRLLYYHGSNLMSEPLDLTGSSLHRVYSRPAVVVEGATTYVYATNQRGQLIEFVHVSGAPGNAMSAPDVVAPAGETDRALMMFQNVEAVLQNGARHIYGTDGTSRLVHYEIRGGGRTRSVFAENVSQLAADSVDDSLDGGDTANDIAFGQFPFQEPYVGRVYSGLTVLAGKEGDGPQFIYGTNGSNLILFIRGDESDTDQRTWTVADLTNDIFSLYGAAGSRERDVPSSRVPANSVFGSPGGYIEPDGDRHIFQINAEGEVIEYYIDFSNIDPSNTDAVARFHTQNINLRTGNSPVTKLLLDADTMDA